MYFQIRKDKLRVLERDNLNSGSVKFYESIVEYDELWQDLIIEAVLIKKGEKQGVPAAVINNVVYIDQKLDGVYYIGFCGFKEENDTKIYQISTNLEPIRFDVGAGSIEVKIENLPTLNEWEIYISQIQKFINESKDIVTQAENLNLEVVKEQNYAILTITRKNGTQEQICIYDGKDYILTEEDMEIIANKVQIPQYNIENGNSTNSLQQKFESESWITTNKKIKECIKNDIVNGDGNKIVYEDLGDENYSIKVTTNGKSAFNQNGKSQTVGGKSHTEGSKNIAFESNAHAEGNETFAGGKHSHAEGNTTSSLGNASHSEGFNTVAIGIASHTEGSETEAIGDFGHAEGALTHANASSAHAEGLESTASGLAAHAEGGHTEATKECAHAEGYYTHAIGQYTHAEGCETTAEGGNAHAEGRNTHAEGWESHAEGGSTYAMGGTSHAEGDSTVAIGGGSHAEGYHTVATANHSHAEGRYNEIDEEGNYVHIVGNGYYDEIEKKEVRSNAHTIDWLGNGWFAGDLTINKTEKVAVANRNNNFSTAQTINGTLTVNGNIVQNGKTYESHAEQIYTKNDLIITREGAVGGLGENQFTGLEAKKYDGENDGQLVFDAKGEARVGDINDTQPLLTRDEVKNLIDGQLLKWDGIQLKAVGTDEYIKNTDYATDSVAGIVKVNTAYGVTMRSNNVLGISAASSTLINEKTNAYRPIVPSNLDYAVKQALANTKLEWTAEEKTKTRDLISAIGTEDYAGIDKYGIIKFGTTSSTGLYTDEEGKIYTSRATTGEIDGKVNTHKVITPANLDYAVREALINTKLPWSDEEKTALRKYFNIIGTADYATSSKAGIMRPANGLFTSGTTGALLIAKASNAQIDAKTDNYYPIVSSNLEYAVKSVVGGHVTLSQTDYDTLVNTGTVTTEDGKTYTYDENTYYYIKEE